MKARGVQTLLAAAWLAGALAVEAAPAADEEEIKRDLSHAVALEGFHCGGVDAFEPDGEAGYLVTCRNGRRFSVRIDRDLGRLTVADAESGEARRRPADHDEHVRRALFTLVNLAGADCAGVAAYERRRSNEHVAVCADGRRFRVHVTPAGRVRVEEHRG